MSASDRHRRLHAAAAFARMARGEMPYQRRGFPGRPLRLATGGRVVDNPDGTFTVYGVLVEQAAPRFPNNPLGPTRVSWFTTEVAQGVTPTSPLEFMRRVGSYAALADVVHTTGPIPEAIVDAMRGL